VISDIDDCANVTCLNNGSCKDGIASFKCNCPTAFVGDYCETGKPNYRTRSVGYSNRCRRLFVRLCVCLSVSKISQERINISTPNRTWDITRTISQPLLNLRSFWPILSHFLGQKLSHY